MGCSLGYGSSEAMPHAASVLVGDSLDHRQRKYSETSSFAYGVCMLLEATSGEPTIVELVIETSVVTGFYFVLFYWFDLRIFKLLVRNIY